MQGWNENVRSVVEGLERSVVGPRVSGRVETVIGGGFCLEFRKEGVAVEMRVPRGGTDREERRGGGGSLGEEDRLVFPPKRSSAAVSLSYASPFAQEAVASHVAQHDQAAQAKQRPVQVGTRVENDEPGICAQRSTRSAACPGSRAQRAVRSIEGTPFREQPNRANGIDCFPEIDLVSPQPRN